MTTSASRDGSRKRVRGSTSRRRSSARPRKKAADRPVPPVIDEPTPELASDVQPVESQSLPPVPLSAVESTFAARMPAPEPERPRPAGRRAIFLDVENTSKAQHLAHVIDHLGVDPWDRRTELVAVANWRVVGHDAARLLAQRGAHLVHSAPSTGVRDWSDLRIAVAAGIWLAAARPGDLIEIVSDDRAFDAVGDVSASLGITFRRLSYRRLKEDTAEPVAVERTPPADGSGSRRRRRRRGRGPAASPTAHGGHVRHAEPRDVPRQTMAPAPRPSGGGRGRGPAPHSHRPPPETPHTAPHDELVSVVRALIEASPRRSVVIDAVANALKSRGFQRPAGSPRLVTRLRRIRELQVSPSGTITLTENGALPREESRSDDRPPESLPVEATPADVEPVDEIESEDDGQEVFLGRLGGAPEPRVIDGNRKTQQVDGHRAQPPAPGRRRRRRRRRGGQPRPATPGPHLA